MSRAPITFVLLTLAVALSLGTLELGYYLGHKASSSTPTSTAASSDITGQLAIDWAPQNQPQAGTFNFYVRQWWQAQHPEIQIDNLNGKILGTVTNGPATGRLLVAETLSVSDGPGSGPTTYYVLEQPNSDQYPIVLTNYVLMTDGYATSSFSTVDEATDDAHVAFSSASVPDLQYPQQITSADHKLTFSFVGAGSLLTAYSSAFNNPVITTVGDDVPVYGPQPEGDNRFPPTDFTYVAGNFYTISKDGRPLWYDLDTPFWKAEAGSAIANVDAVWDDSGVTTSADYFKGLVGGCGFVSNANVIAADKLPALKVAGHAATDAALTFSVPVDYTDPLVINDYNTWKAQHDNQSVAAFAATHPFFYYHDQIGRWIKFTSTDDVPPGECGKPVIYLYPTHTEDINVSLKPQGGFTKTEPAYNDGWSVTASPDGTLVNKADGQTYPYLFWEGRGGLYQSPDKYWVVAQADVHAFLLSTLAKLGLNAQETSDFMAFWEPRMQGSPYYQVGFYGTGVMNSLAPLSLSTPPDTLIRILMDYQPLSTQKLANPPILPPTPARNGFTVVEWGGVLR